ncbi:MAG: NAD-dependent epimerase/dehydratase family protein, partial [Spirochaetia bacterium]|nr:NAD-dependent epimerase/dehydratase family protein [Spirochaetia bacterium]
MVLTGCAGFLGFSFLHFFCRHAASLGVKKIIGLDRFLLGRPVWLDRLAKDHALLEIRSFDVAGENLPKDLENATHVIHLASIASPTFYRKYPLETVDANVWGLRRLLDFYREKKSLRGLLFFSSSEIYGDPAPEAVPTDEEYRGNTSAIGPRACYDESKRFGETLCYLYAEKYGLPVTIVRPFNNYGPGMALRDLRLPSDFAKAILENRDLEMLSDGTPRRTFCYTADAIFGYVLALCHGQFDYFN